MLKEDIEKKIQSKKKNKKRLEPGKPVEPATRVIRI